METEKLEKQIMKELLNQGIEEIKNAKIPSLSENGKKVLEEMLDAYCRPSEDFSVKITNKDPLTYSYRNRANEDYTGASSRDTDVYSDGNITTIRDEKENPFSYTTATIKDYQITYVHSRHFSCARNSPGYTAHYVEVYVKDNKLADFVKELTQKITRTYSARIAKIKEKLETIPVKQLEEILDNGDKYKNVGR